MYGVVLILLTTEQYKQKIAGTNDSTNWIKKDKTDTILHGQELSKHNLEYHPTRAPSELD